MTKSLFFSVQTTKQFDVIIANLINDLFKDIKYISDYLSQIFNRICALTLCITGDS